MQIVCQKKKCHVEQLIEKQRLAPVCFYVSSADNRRPAQPDAPDTTCRKNNRLIVPRPISVCKVRRQAAACYLPQASAPIITANRERSIQ
jgi:hypothetical protein